MSERIWNDELHIIKRDNDMDDEVYVIVSYHELHQFIRRVTIIVAGGLILGIVTVLYEWFNNRI